MTNPKDKNKESQSICEFKSEMIDLIVGQDSAMINFLDLSDKVLLKSMEVSIEDKKSYQKSTSFLTAIENSFNAIKECQNVFFDNINKYLLFMEQTFQKAKDQLESAKENINLKRETFSNQYREEN
jgi:hypothetical protein